MKELKAMNILKQCRDNFQFGGKDKLNLKVFFTSLKRWPVFSEIWKYYNYLGIKVVKNIWNLKRVWITPKSFCDFQAYCPGVCVCQE